jgi:hypothetical protein
MGTGMGKPEVDVASVVVNYGHQLRSIAIRVISPLRLLQ